MEYINVDDVTGICRGNKCLFSAKSAKNIKFAFGKKGTKENALALEWVRQRRPNSKWVLEQVTNVTFFITKLRGHPIGRGTDLPDYLSKNNGLLPLDRNHNTGKPYNDNLCFFRALALHNGCHPKNLERDAKHYYEQY